MLPVADRHNDRAEEVASQLYEAGLRAEADVRAEKVGRKIGDAEELKVPCMLVVGEREVESGQVSVRRRGKGDLGASSLEELRDALLDEVRTRQLET